MTIVGDGGRLIIEKLTSGGGGGAFDPAATAVVKPVYQKELSGEAVCRPGSVSSVAGSGIASSQYQFTPPSAGMCFIQTHSSLL